MTKMDKFIDELSGKVTDSLAKDESFQTLVKALVKPLVQAMLTDPEILQSLATVVPKEEGGKTITAKKTTRKTKTPAVLNPFEVAQEGMDALKAKIEQLEVSQLKDIIRDYDLDPYKKVSSCRKAEKFINHILETVESRLKAGSGYKNSL